MRIFGIEVTVDFSPPFARGEEVIRNDGAVGHVTHFDGDEGYNNSNDEDVWVEWSDGRKSWEYPNELRKKSKRSATP